MEEEMMDLGDKVVDKITGFTGIATAMTLYLHRAPLVEVTGQELLDGKAMIVWFDEPRLEILTKNEYKYDDEPEQETIKN